MTLANEQLQQVQKSVDDFKKGMELRGELNLRVAHRVTSILRVGMFSFAVVTIIMVGMLIAFTSRVTDMIVVLDTTRASKDTSNRILTILKAVLNVAYEDENISSRSAWETIKPFVNVGQSRELFLSDDEVKRLLDIIKGGFKEIIQGAILTGARYGELCSVLVEDYDKANGTIRFKGKTGSRNTALSSGAITFFNQLTQSKLPKANIFIKEGGVIWGKSHQSRPMKEAVINAKLPHNTVFYSLRHYHISKALLAGVNIHALAKNCGTSIRMIESNYGKFIKSDVKSMLDNIILSA